MFTSTTFVIVASQAAEVLDRLRSIGFQFDAPQAVTRTLLDTFDGRVHAAGMRLAFTEAQELEVELSGYDAVTKQLVIAGVPSYADDLPPGTLHDRLAALTDVRLLTPQVRLAATRTRGSLRDRSNRVTIIATLSQHLAVLGHNTVDLPEATVEIHQVRRSRHRANAAIGAVEQLGSPPLDADTLTMAAVAAGVSLAGASGEPTVPLDPTMPAIDGFRAVLANLSDTIASNQHGTIHQLDPEFLHDFRVAVRRTRAVLGHGRKVLPVNVADAARAGFARLGTLTGPARDLDVYLLGWKTYTGLLDPDSVAALQPVRDLLEQRREAAHSALAHALQSADVAHLTVVWRTWLHEPRRADGHAVNGDRPLGKVVVKRIARAQSDLIDHGRLIGTDTPAEHLHDLRKEAKKLRYLFECFGSLFAEAPRKAFVRRLKALQDNLGEHQDAEVHIAELRAIGDELNEIGTPAATTLAITRLAEQLDRQRSAARAEFAERFADYDTPTTERDLAAALHTCRR